MTDPVAYAKDPKLLAAVEMIGRTGATHFGLRYQDDEQPRCVGGCRHVG